MLNFWLNFRIMKCSKSDTTFIYSIYTNMTQSRQAILAPLKSHSPALHLFKCSIDIVTNGFDFQLLVNKLILNLVNPDV